MDLLLLLYGTVRAPRRLLRSGHLSLLHPHGRLHAVIDGLTLTWRRGEGKRRIDMPNRH